MKKIVLSIVTITIFAMISAFTLSSVFATSGSLKDQQKQTKKELDKIENQIDSLNEQQGAISDEIDEIDQSLVDLMASISILEDELAQKQAEIAQTQIDYDAAVLQKQEQYTSMKFRIRYIYENLDQTITQTFFEAEGFTDLLNKADYIESLYSYDRQMLSNYEETVAYVAALWDELLDQESELNAIRLELQEEKDSLEIKLEEKKHEYSDYETKINSAKALAGSYKAKIKEQDAAIKKALAAEEAARKKAAQAAAKPSASGSTAAVPVNVAATINNANGSAKGKEIASFGCKFVGNPYVAGGSSLTNGADCSGFTQAVFQNFGIKLPRSSSEQRFSGTEVAYSDAQPGDLICYAGHVGLYIGGGMIVHASTERTGIKISNAGYRTILSVRRIV